MTGHGVDSHHARPRAQCRSCRSSTELKSSKHGSLTLVSQKQEDGALLVPMDAMTLRPEDEKNVSLGETLTTSTDDGHDKQDAHCSGVSNVQKPDESISWPAKWLGAYLIGNACTLSCGAEGSGASEVCDDHAGC